MFGQHFFTKSVLKRSGPGDLSLGRFLTTESISAVVKGSVCVLIWTLCSLFLSCSSARWILLDSGAAWSALHGTELHSFFISLYDKAPFIFMIRFLLLDVHTMMSWSALIFWAGERSLTWLLLIDGPATSIILLKQIAICKCEKQKASTLVNKFSTPSYLRKIKMNGALP
jgi:hypothetical protein